MVEHSLKLKIGADVSTWTQASSVFSFKKKNQWHRKMLTNWAEQTASNYQIKCSFTWLTEPREHSWKKTDTTQKPSPFLKSCVMIISSGFPLWKMKQCNNTVEVKVTTTMNHSRSSETASSFRAISHKWCETTILMKLWLVGCEPVGLRRVRAAPGSSEETFGVWGYRKWFTITEVKVWCMGWFKRRSWRG